MLVAGCKQSLFDNHSGGDDDTTDANMSDGAVPATCGAQCLADLGADFCGTKLQCVDDHRDRTWAPMTAMGPAYVGATAANRIAMGTGAALVSTAGNSDSSDPAISYTSGSNQVIKLSVVVDFPAGAASHVVRLYRNAREDVLFSAIGADGSNVSTTMTVDAFNGDRFYLALAPMSAGATNISVKFFVNGTSMFFPQDCKLGLQFSMASGHTVPNECSADPIVYYHNNGDNSFTGTNPVLVAGPFNELGMAGDVSLEYLFSGAAPVDRSGETTTQFWYKHRSFDPTYDAYVYSDTDCEATNGAAFGGLAVIRNPGMITIGTCTETSSVTASGSFPDDTAWHFIRVVHTGGNVNLCVDGAKRATYALPMGEMHTDNAPYIGENVDYSPVSAELDASIDDVRVLTTALPCN